MSELELKQEAEIKGKKGLRLKFSLSTAILVSMVAGILVGIPKTLRLLDPGAGGRKARAALVGGA